MPWAITPILMLGGAYLCFEGAEKVMEKLSSEQIATGKTLASQAAELSSAQHEANMVKSAVRTDLILSAEIMAIALNEVSSQTIWMQAGSLVFVSLAITLVVYGVVGLIVKIDDISLHLAQRQSRSTQAVGRALVRAMPKLLALLAAIGTAAMLWVGGQIMLHGLHIHPAKHMGLTSGAAEWITDAALSGVFGLALGAVIVWVHHRFTPARKLAS